MYDGYVPEPERGDYASDRSPALGLFRNSSTTSKLAARPTLAVSEQFQALEDRSGKPAVIREGE